jgi:hypothetical protein
MGWEKVAFVRTVEVSGTAVSNVTLTVYSDQPGAAMALRETKTCTPVAGPRNVWKFHLSGTTKGRLFRWQLVSSGLVRVFAIRVYARETGGDWQWYTVEVDPSPATWTEHPLPIAGTSDDYPEHPLPIAATSDEYSPHPLPIDPTADEYSVHPLPIVATSAEYTEHPLPIAGTSDEYTPHPLPIAPTGDEYKDIEIPFPRTPDIYEWVPVPVTP